MTITHDTSVDVFTSEIIRQRLYQVIEEAIAALKNVSGSPITNEGHDMMVSVYTETGDLAVGGVGFLHHLTSAAQAVKHVVQTYSEDPGIFEGDVYMLNDSYTAALHPPDVYIISPIHFEGTLTGFVANFVHVTDIGAVDAGGFSPHAEDVFQEGFITQGLKIVERGRTRRDVLETLLRNVRDPGMTNLDLKSQLAANHVAAERMQKLYRDYGVDVVQAVSRGMVEESESLLRRRLLELPDGTWRARQYLDLPTGLHRVELAMTKEVDQLTYDFTGTDPQVPVGVNCCYWAAWGGLFAPMFPLLCWDIPWNEGITRPVSMIAPEGSLVNCTRPAPISVATVGVIQVVNNLSVTTLSKMMGASVSLHDRSTAVWHGSHLSVMLSGLDHSGDFYVTLLTDTFAGSGGGRAKADGIDIGGEIPNVVSRWANAETQEHHSPVRYLFRRAVPDSGGPGKYRGGVSHEYAVAPYGGQGQTTVGLCAKGVAAPMSTGMFGGLPGCNIGLQLFRKSNLDDCPDQLDTLTGATTESVQWGDWRLDEDDVLYVRFMGGGGYGDPLERDFQALEHDVLLGLVSTEAAYDIYGAVFDDVGRVDPEASRRRRLDIRAERIGRSVPDHLTDRAAVGASHPLGEYLQVVDDNVDGPGIVQCTWCGATVCQSDQRWKDHAHRRESPPPLAGRHRDSAPNLVLRQFYCNTCATLLDTEVTLADDPPLFDEIRRWPHPLSDSS